MKKAKAIALALALFLVLPCVAGAKVVQPDPAFSLDVPEGWQIATEDFEKHIPQQVSAIFDGADLQPPRLKLIGWRMDAAGKVENAFCVSYMPTGMGKFYELLKSSSSKEREVLGAGFSDAFASALKKAYEVDRRMKLKDTSTDFIEAGNDFLLLVDARVIDGSVTRIRSASVFIHGDRLLGISWIQDENAPESIAKSMEYLVYSLNWLQ